MAKNKSYPFKNLVFEGGGIKGLAYVGALKVLDERGITSQIARVGGTSAGAITACLVSIGYTSHDIQRILVNTDFGSFKDDSPLFIPNIFLLLRNYGWFKGQRFNKWIVNLITKKLGKNVTFQELVNMKNSHGTKELYVIAANLTKTKEIVFSHEKYQNIKVSDAVRMSMSIPLFFASVNSFGDVFSDGGLYNNYPIDLFDDEKYLGKDSSMKIYNKETLGFRVDTTQEIKYSSTMETVPYKINSLGKYVQALIGGLIDISNKRHLTDKDWHRTVYIDAGNISATQFELTHEQKKSLVNSGEKGTIDYFKWFDKPPKDVIPLNK